MTSSPLYLTSHPLYLTSGPLYLCHHTHPIDDITATICMISHPVYLWHPINYIYNIIPTMYDGTILCVDETTPGICMTSFELQKMSHPLFHTNHSIYAVTSTSGMTSYSLYQTSHTLYLCHHNLSTDITPSLVSHQTHYMSDIICTIYNITSTPYFITYCTYDITPSIYETKSSMQGNIYTTHVTSQPLICVITPTLLRTSQQLYGGYHIRYICEIISPVYMT